MSKWLAMIGYTCFITGGMGVSWATEPPCRHPAPLDGQFQPERISVLVVVKRDKDLDRAARRLAIKFHFQPVLVRHMHGFTAVLDQESDVAKLRCEPAIESLSYGDRTQIQ